MMNFYFLIVTFRFHFLCNLTTLIIYPVITYLCKYNIRLLFYFISCFSTLVMLFIP